MSDEADTDGEFWEEPEDPWPDEPDEFDPFSLGPGVPEAPDPTSGDVDVSADLVKAFWAAVLFANVGLLGVSLGPMLIVFEGRRELGLSVFLVGVLSLVFAYRRYRGYVGDGDGGSDGESPDGEPDRGGPDGENRDAEAAAGGSSGGD